MRTALVTRRSLGAIAAFACGCGQATTQVPLACKQDAATVVHALAAAPGRVALGGTRISRCFVARSDQADVEALGSTLVPAADELAAAARTQPRAALELGYLIGAARRGAGRTNGIHGELLRRLELDGIGARAGPASTSASLAAGTRAGERGG